MERQWTIDFNDEEALAKQFDEAKKHYQHELETKAIALSARYNEEVDLIEINLKDGSTFTVSPYSVQGLRGGTPEQLNDLV